MKNIDLMGMKFGKLTVIRKAEDYVSPKGKHESKWLCKCECGNEKSVRQSDLHSRRTQSCGKCKSALNKTEQKKLYGKFLDITNQKFGKLTALYRVGQNNKHHSIWHCKCECGKEKDILIDSLRSGRTKSCGCLVKQKTTERNTIHGFSKTRIYKEWKAMKERCYRMTHQYYNYYGGKGIEVCEEWKNSFKNFYEWAINNGYQDDLTLDRMDNNKDYMPNNCKWSTQIEQANNRTNNIEVFYDNDWRSVNEVAKIIDRTYGYVYQHYRNLGLTRKKGRI